MKAKIKSRDTQTGWVDGTIGKYTFQAKVYDEGSTFGINNGRVSKLMIWDEEIRKRERNIFTAVIVHYVRGWDIKPETSENKKIYEKVMEALTVMPRIYKGIK